MKKLLIGVIAVMSLLAVSCKKDTQSGPAKSVNNTDNVKKYKVTYTFDGFSQTTTNLSGNKARVLAKSILAATPADTLAQAITQYYYIVYDNSGKEIKRIKRHSGRASFEQYYHENGQNYNNGNADDFVSGLEDRLTTDPYNVITDSLAAGTYTVVLVGSTDDMGINLHDTSTSDDQYVTYSPLSSAKVYQNDAIDILPWSQVIFFGKKTVTVGNSNSTQSLSISRVVGQLEVNIEDAIPANVKTIAIAGVGNNAAFLFGQEISADPIEGGSDESDIDFIFGNITASDIGKTNYQVYGYIMNVTTPMSIIIKAYDASNNLITSKTVNNVQFGKNKRTILSGRLFTPAATQFNITANQAWDPNVTIIHF